MKLIERGGKGGGGAVLTKEGEEAIQRFNEFNADFQAFLVAASAKLNR